MGINTMNRFIRVLIFLSICFFSSLTAQDFAKQFRDAKDLFATKKYSQSMTAFKPLMVYSAGNIYSEYAAFYYAVSAYHLNYKTVARQGFQNILSAYGNWPQLDEVRYWLAKIYFEEKEYFQAFKILSQVMTDPGITELKNKHLSSISDSEILRMLLEDFKDKQIAWALINRLIKDRKSAGIQEARMLIKKFGFSEDEFQLPEPGEVFLTNRQVSVLFPFMSETMAQSPGARRNQYAIDLYQGMRLGLDSLEKSGIDLKLNLYDTERNPEKVKQILGLEEIKSSDLIVGPLFADEFVAVKAFSQQEKISLINPISSNPDFISGNPNAILFQASYETIGRRSAEFLASLNLNKPCMVFYDRTTKDSIIAHAFRKRAADLKIRIAAFKEVPKENSAAITAMLVTPVRYDKWRNPVDFSLKRDSIGSIFVAAESELIFTKVITAVDSRNEDIKIIGHESWLDKPGMDLIKFEQLGITLAAPNHISQVNPSYAHFQQQYLSLHKTLPTIYARLGFEFALFLGSRFNASDANAFEAISKSGKTNGWLTYGFDYNNTQDNQLVPFMAFEGGELVRKF
jgi:hypothetical protein